MFQKKKKDSPEQLEAIAVKDFFDMILPGVVKFMSDHYICGDAYCCVWAIREYPPSTEAQAILSQLADRSNITLRVYNRLVDSMEQRKIIQNATRRNKLMSGGTDVQETLEAENNLKDVIELLANLRKNREPLLHCAVYMELKAPSLQKLKELQSDVLMELTRSKINIDRLNLRQKEGFLSVTPFGANQFGTQFERVLPASAVANLYPFNYSGKTDPHGFYLGRDKFGTNILTDFDRRADDKTNSNILILGNSGQGKSHLLKGIVSNLRESGKSIILMDAESEYQDLTNALGGCYLDFMTGQYVINPLQPMKWEGDNDREADDENTPETFRKTSALSRHISYLKDFFRAYKDFSTIQLDTIEFMLQKLYRRFDMDDHTDFSSLPPDRFPTMSDFYDLLEDEYNLYDQKKKNLFTEETLQEICLALNSMCEGAEARFFNGHTNIKDDKFLCFGVKDVLNTNKSLNRGRTAQSVRPRWCVWENVPGAYSSGEPPGEDFRIVLQSFVRISCNTVSIPRPDSGKWKSAGRILLGDTFSLAWRTLDAQYWSVPQRRVRVYLIADFAGGSASKILFDEKGLFGNSPPGQGTWETLAAATGDSAEDTGQADTS